MCRPVVDGDGCSPMWRWCSPMAGRRSPTSPCWVTNAHCWVRWLPRRRCGAPWLNSLRRGWPRSMRPVPGCAATSGLNCLAGCQPRRSPTPIWVTWWCSTWTPPSWWPTVRRRPRHQARATSGFIRSGCGVTTPPNCWPPSCAQVMPGPTRPLITSTCSRQRSPRSLEPIAGTCWFVLMAPGRPMDC